MGFIYKYDMENQNYSIPELQEKVRKAVRSFLRKDSCLLELQAHEQAISHRIAYYLEYLFYKRQKLSVDCEYNKHLDNAKKIKIDFTKYTNEEFKKCGCSSCERFQKNSQIPEKRFRPDVIVHSRGNDNRILIVVEMKTNKICPFDMAKLRALTKPKKQGGGYEYQLGVFIHFPARNPEYKWFVDGKHYL